MVIIRRFYEPDESNKYLEFRHLAGNRHFDIKMKQRDNFFSCVNCALKTFLNLGNKVRVINTFVVPLLILDFGVVKWSKTDLENFERRVWKAADRGYSALHLVGSRRHCIVSTPIASSGRMSTKPRSINKRFEPDGITVTPTYSVKHLKKSVGDPSFNTIINHKTNSTHRHCWCCCRTAAAVAASRPSR